MGQFLGIHASIGKRLAGGPQAEIRGVVAIIQPVALFDTGAGNNPFVVGVYHLGKIVIRQHRIWHIGAQGKQMTRWIHRNTVG